MGKIKEKEAADLLLTNLSKLLRLKGKKRDDLAKDIDDLASFDLMEYNKAYENFSEELKDIMDSLFLMHKWEGTGIHYGKKLFFGVKDVKELVSRLKKLKTEL